MVYEKQKRKGAPGKWHLLHTFVGFKNKAASRNFWKVALPQYPDN